MSREKNEIYRRTSDDKVQNDVMDSEDENLILIRTQADFSETNGSPPDPVITLQNTEEEVDENDLNTDNTLENEIEDNDLSEDITLENEDLEEQEKEPGEDDVVREEESGEDDTFHGFSSEEEEDSSEDDKPRRTTRERRPPRVFTYETTGDPVIRKR